MAQGSFLYELKMELDTGGLSAQVQNQMEDISTSITDVGERTDMLERQLKRLFDFSNYDFETAQRGFNQIEQSAVDGFTRARKQLHGLADRMNQDVDEMVQNAARLQTAGGQAFDDLRNTQSPAQQRFRSQTPSMGSGASQALRNNLRQVREEVTNLEGRGSASVQQLANSFTGLNSDVSSLQASLSTLMGNLEATGQSLKDLSTDNPFDHLEEGARSVPRSINEIRQEILQSDSSLQELAATADRSWGRITNGALEAAEGADRMGASIVQNAEQAEQGLKGMQSQMVRSRGATYSLGSSASSAASQLSVDLTQSAQDAAFGIENLAASAPFLAEQFGRVRRQTGSFTGALGDIGSALMGPTGVIAGFTLLLTYKDSIISFFSNIEENTEDAIEAFKDFAQGVTEAGEAADRAEGQLTSFLELEDDETNLFKALRNVPEDQAGKFFGKLEKEASNAATQLQNTRQEFEQFAEEEASGFQVELVKDAGVDTLKRYANTAKGAGDKLAQMRLDMIRQREEIKQINHLMMARSDEQIKLEKRAAKMAENSRLSAEYIERVLRAEKKNSEEKEKQNQLLLDRLGIRQKLLNEMTDTRIENTSEDMPVFAATRRVQEDFARRREDIAAQFEEQRQKVREELEKGSEAFQNKMAQINEREEQTMSTFQQRRAQAMREARSEAREEVAQDTMIEPDDINFMENPVLVNGQFVERSKFLQQQKRQWQQTQTQLQAEREELRIRQEGGQISGFFDQLGAAQIQHQLDMIEKEENLLKKRVQKQIAYLQTIQMLYSPESAKYQEIQSRIEAAQNNLANIEARMQQRRLSKQEQFLRNMVNNIESTPLGDAYSNMFMKAGSAIQTFRESDWAEKNMKERAQMISSAGSAVVSSFSNIAEASYNSWKSKRQEDLKEQGKSQKERRKIIKKEGKKRFQMMKAMKLASAVASGLEAQIHAWTKGMSAGGPPLAIAMSAASAAKTGFLINKIASMSIGDTISGGAGGGGGAGAPSGKFTQRAAASSATMASKVGTDMQADRRNDEDKIKKTAERVGQEVGKQMPDKVTMDRNTAENAQEAANKQQTKLNK